MNCKITTITPCHIGSGNVLQRNIGFLVKNDTLGIIDIAKVYAYVGDNGIDRWCRAITNREDLLSVFRGNITDFCNTTMPINGSGVSQLREHIRTRGELYFPGSSIKGAVVSAILGQECDLDIPERINKSNNRTIDMFFSKREVNSRNQVKYNPKTSVLRFLRIGDAMFEKQSPIAYKCYSLNERYSHDNLTDEKLSQYVECIAPGCTASFRLCLEIDNLNRAKQMGVIGNIPKAIKSINDLIQTINNQTIWILENEIAIWKDTKYDETTPYIEQITHLLELCNECEPGKEAIIRLGYGIGWKSITGNWSEEVTANNEEAWKRILNCARPGNEAKYSEYQFPKTRRVANYIIPLGFAKIKLEQ